MKEIVNIVYDNWPKNSIEPIYPPFDFLSNNEFEIVRYRLSDIEKFPNKIFNYFYLLVRQKGEDVEYKIHNNINLLSLDVIECLKKYKNLNIIFSSDFESETLYTIALINEWSKSLKLNQKQLWIINNNKRLLEYKELLQTDINFYVYDTTFVFLTQSISSINESDFIEDKNGSFFMCLNNNSRVHRPSLIALLMKNNLLDNIDWSYLKPKLGESEYAYYSCINKENYSTLLHDIININSQVKISNFEKQYGQKLIEENKSIYSYGSEMSKNSYFNIITETTFDGSEIFVTEKTHKPFYFFQFPLILATYEHIKYTKSIYNYDFFDDIIDHSYDNEPNDQKRLLKFVDEIKRINENKDYFINFYKNNKDRFIENQKKVLNLSKGDSNNKLLKLFSER